jgi:hypothetical protein
MIGALVMVFQLVFSLHGVQCSHAHSVHTYGDNGDIRQMATSYRRDFWSSVPDLQHFH